MLSTQRPDLYIMENEKGRAVYSASDIEAGELIEICPVIVLNTEDTTKIHRTLLHDYYFIWDFAAKTSAIALGYGSLYNHAEEPNAEFEIDLNSDNIRIVAKRAIEAHEEILIHYMSEQQTEHKIWFEPDA